jgi:quercetin dioxygenase-like cupin family protein
MSGLWPPGKTGHADGRVRLFPPVHRLRCHRQTPARLLQVQQGTITVVVADQPFILDAGDAVTFPGDVAHSYANPGTEPARFSLAVFEPGVGSGHRPTVT